MTDDKIVDLIQYNVKLRKRTSELVKALDLYFDSDIIESSDLTEQAYKIRFLLDKLKTVLDERN